MRSARILALGLSLIAPAVYSQPITQVTFVRGNTLSQLINNLYGGNGIDLAHTGHEAHFGETRDFQNFSDTLRAALQSRSFIPVPSSVGLVAYRFNEATGTYERVEGALGPILSERGSTSGKGTLNFSTTYTFASYDTVNGSDVTQLVLHHCLTPDCVGSNPLTSPYLHDTVDINVHFRLKSQAIALAAVYGLTTGSTSAWSCRMCAMTFRSSRTPSSSWRPVVFQQRTFSIRTLKPPINTAPATRLESATSSRVRSIA